MAGATDLSQLQAERQTAASRAAVRSHRLWLAPRLHGWKWMAEGEDGEAWLGRINGQPISVIWSIATESDGQSWLHVSLSHRSRIPTWTEVAEVKRTFVGDHRYAAQVHPPLSAYVNIHPHVLHLWSPCDRWPLPEFSAELGGGRTV